MIVLHGRGGGGPKVSGVIRTRNDWEPGAVLVAEMTTPDDIAYMAEAQAVVTDNGGVLCHAAINCMEMGVPFVVGTGNATELPSGTFVLVDPTAGTVVVDDQGS